MPVAFIAALIRRVAKIGFLEQDLPGAILDQTRSDGDLQVLAKADFLDLRTMFAVEQPVPLDAFRDPLGVFLGAIIDNVDAPFIDPRPLAIGDIAIAITRHAEPGLAVKGRAGQHFLEASGIPVSARSIEAADIHRARLDSSGVRRDDARGVIDPRRRTGRKASQCQKPRNANHKRPPGNLHG